MSNMRGKLIENIMFRDCGKEEYLKYSSFNVDSIETLSEPVKKMLASVPPSFGSCVMMSAGFVVILETVYSIPAIAVLGDFKIHGIPIFECKENIPILYEADNLEIQKWDGHCWVEIDNIICDLSIFRSAYRINEPSLLKNYVLQNFGKGKGAFLSPIDCLTKDIEYVPKFVLNRTQIRAALEGLSIQQKGGIPLIPKLPLGNEL